MIRKIHAAIREHRLLARDDHALVAVSGGADSVCLLLALHELAPGLGIGITVAHLDHRLRGAESRRDAQFVEELCSGLDVRCLAGASDVRRRARSKGLSLEMAAREARYEFFARCTRRAGANVVATAHTADDQAETVLLKIVRGAGAAGLSGIPRSTVLSGTRVVRPLLGINRAEVEDFLATRGQRWREDASNADVRFLRNRVRREVLPLLESRLNPSVRRALCRTADVFSEEEPWIDGLAEDLLRTCRRPGTPDLEIEPLLGLALGPRRRVIRRWLVSEGVPLQAVGFDAVARVNELAAAGRSGGSVDAGGGWIVKSRYGELLIVPAVGRAASAFRATVNVPGETVLLDAGLRIAAAIRAGVDRPRPTRAGALPASASISRDAVRRRRIDVRSWRAGDRIRPMGLAGSKKIQDIFVDGKVPPEQRSRVPLFECGGEIIWLPGYRVARGWEVTDPTRPALQISVERV